VAAERLAIFGYGSLVSRTSAEQTLGREVPPPVPALLDGWVRRWSLVRDNLRSEKTFSLHDGTLPAFFCGLTLEPRSGAPPNGGLVEVSEAELVRLDLRELRYDRVEVTDAVEPATDFDRVFAYVAKPGHHRPELPPGTVLAASYLREIERGFAALGTGELDRFHRTTGECPAPVVEVILVRDEIPAGNPRQW
jgi:cation transport regulator ChaC